MFLYECHICRVYDLLYDKCDISQMQQITHAEPMREIVLYVLSRALEGGVCEKVMWLKNAFGLNDGIFFQEVRVFMTEAMLTGRTGVLCKMDKKIKIPTLEKLEAFKCAISMGGMET